MKKNRLWIILIPVVLLAVIAIGIAGFFFLDRNKSAENYTDLIVLAQKELDEGNIDAGIAAYERAIANDPTDQRAYVALLDLYYDRGETEQMESILRRYEIATNDTTLQNRYAPLIERLLQQQQQAETTPLTEAETENDDKEKTKQPVQLQTQILSFIAGATYADYQETYGSASISYDGNTSVLQYDTIPLKVTYSDESGTVSIDNSGTPYSISVPTSVQVTDLSLLLIGMTGQTSLDMLQKDDVLRSATVESSGESYYLQFQSNDCQVKIACDADGTISGTDAWNEIRPTGTSSSQEISTLSGTVVNAATGFGVSNAVIKFRAGLDKTFGDTVEQFETTLGGAYEVELEPGDYTAEVSAPGFITEYFEVNIHSWMPSVDMDFVIAPELEEGQIRIVLEWGAFPSDLDSHLIGTSSSGQSIHLDFTNMDIDGVAHLDVDDTDAYGPETVTISDIDGSFEFVVVDYDETGAMGQSEARVKIYMPGESAPTIVEVPQDAVNRWTVCKIKNGTLTVVNQTV